jgi:hypothetical protein
MLPIALAAAAQITQNTHLEIRINLRPRATTAAPPPAISFYNSHFAKLAFGTSQSAAWVDDSKCSDG